MAESGSSPHMSKASQPRAGAGTVFRFAGLIYHATVRSLRMTHGNAVAGLLMNVMQTIIFVFAFVAMFALLGMRGAAIRGDFLLYIMSGIFLFMTHTKALSAVVAAEGPASPMMKHAPMNTSIAIAAAALGSLYIQLLSMVLVLGIYHLAITRVVIDQPAGALGMMLLSWFSGVSIGMVFLSVKPWFPGVVQMVTNVYSRANMVASGKMFVANQMPGYLLVYFTWNPLFHTIDQCRGFVFINYNPHHSDPVYPLVLSVGLLFLGLMSEFRTRKRLSISRQARL